ncbi:unnamed protein product, partial [Mesorhabditis belari]|uniref:Mitochondrial import inner membrane translocase subunit n=1 Tax=Mesorhabditis belari TaxID=2138241 RepID=A0AAF3J977_9BILA
MSEAEISTFRDFLKQYNVVTEQCFGACINDMTTSSVSDTETRCTTNCLDKFLKMSQRLSARFAEHQMITAEANGATLPK